MHDVLLYQETAEALGKRQDPGPADTYWDSWNA